MKIFESPLVIFGLSAELICALAGLMMLLGIFPYSKVISAKHILNRQVGKGFLVMFGAMLSFNLVDIYSESWSGWLTFLICALCIIIVLIGALILMPAMTEIKRMANQGNNRKIP